MWDLTSFLAMAWRHPIVLAVIAGMAASYGSAFLAREVGDCLTAASISREMLRAVKIQGDGAMDSASVVTVIERLANTVVKARG